jgi:putative ABC transport system substrate-binding protein
MAELVDRQVAVIAAPAAIASALAAKAATRTIPIVFMTGVDPVEFGLVASLAHPGGNLTGVAQLQSRYVAKRLDVVHQLIPAASTVALLTNPANQFSRVESREGEAAARFLGLQLHVANATNQSEIEASFPSLIALGARAVMIGGDVLFFVQRSQIVALAAQYAIPALGQWREYPEAGGLMSYGNNISDAIHLVGIYVGRMLKGEKPAEMPVQQPTRFELIISRPPRRSALQFQTSYSQSPTR